MQRRVAGFTILEIFVALSIAAVLAAIAVPTYRGYRERARFRTAVMQISALEDHIGAFELEHRVLPPNLDVLGVEDTEDPWGNPYEYLRIEGAPPSVNGQVRKDKNLVPINTDYDLYSKGPDGQSVAPLTANHSKDDVVRANDGGFVGLAAEY